MSPYVWNRRMGTPGSHGDTGRRLLLPGDFAAAKEEERRFGGDIGDTRCGSWGDSGDLGTPLLAVTAGHHMSSRRSMSETWP